MHFALLICSATRQEIYENKCDYQKTKIRTNLFEWANDDGVAKIVEHYHVIPNYERKGLCHING